MANLDQVVNISITRETVFPAQKAFGVPLFAAYHTFWLDTVKSFTSDADLATAGVPAAHPIRVWANKVLSQSPHPDHFIIGKRSLPFTQTLQLRPLNTTQGYVYTFTYTDAEGVVTPITYTVGAAATTTIVAAAIAALLDVLADSVVTASVGVITCTSTAGKVVTFGSMPPLAVMTITETTADPGIATDLTNIEIATAVGGASVDWFLLNLDVGGKLTILAAMAWIEARQRVGIFQSNDSAICDPASTTDVAYAAKAAAYFHSFVMYSQTQTNDYREGALAAQQLPNDPGSSSWAHKTVAGITGDTLLDSEASAAEAKNATTYRAIGGLNDTFETHTPDGDYFDVAVFLIWQSYDIQVTVYGGLKTLKKLPFTDDGIQAAVGWTKQSLKRGLNQGGWSTMPTVTAPKLADTNPADRSVRTLNYIGWQGVLAGAIHKIKIVATVGV